jgi:N-acetylglucosamine kinase-like BadF-type ATPase
LGDRRALVAARAAAGPGNPLSSGFRVAFRSYESVVRRLLRRAGVGPDDIRAVALGAAGAGRPAECRRIAAQLRRLLPGALVSVTSDADIALFGATGGRPGMLVLAGTGSIVLGLGEDGAVVRAGGWGYLLGDEGSGAALGREAVKAVLRAEDGRGPRTRLRGAVLRRFQARSCGELVSRIYRRPPPARTFARLWPDLLAAAAKGDLAARLILRAGGEELAETVEAVASRLHLAPPVSLTFSGGVLSRGSLLRRVLLRRLRATLPGVRVRPALAPPEVGALLKAISLAG